MSDDGLEELQAYTRRRGMSDPRKERKDGKPVWVVTVNPFEPHFDSIRSCWGATPRHLMDYLKQRYA